jgi:ribosomal protein L37E
MTKSPIVIKSPIEPIVIKSPIEPGGETPAPRPRRQRANAEDIDLGAVMKARKEQDRILRARLKQIDKEINVLMNEHDEICDVLGIERPVSEQQAEPSRDEPDKPQYEYTCADCGSHAGPDPKGDCATCGAGPFEQAR